MTSIPSTDSAIQLSFDSPHLCECGCGQFATRGHRFIRFHRAKLDVQTEATFWAKVDKSADMDACWPWLGKRSQRGYGALKWHNKDARAHRVAWELTNGPIPTGLLIRHRCDNPPCCNPSHLLRGTSADNMADKVLRGRSAAKERHGRAKLTPSDIVTIRTRHKMGTATCKQLALEFHVSVGHIWRIVNGIAW